MIIRFQRYADRRRRQAARIVHWHIGDTDGSVRHRSHTADTLRDLMDTGRRTIAREMEPPPPELIPGVGSRW
jgi:hypothetical protein